MPGCSVLSTQQLQFNFTSNAALQHEQRHVPVCASVNNASEDGCELAVPLAEVSVLGQTVEWNACQQQACAYYSRTSPGSSTGACAVVTLSGHWRDTDASRKMLASTDKHACPERTPGIASKLSTLLDTENLNHRSMRDLLEDLARSTEHPEVQLELLKQELSSSKETTSAVAQVVAARIQRGIEQNDDESLVQSCKLVRAICLAGGCSHLANSSIPGDLFRLLVHSSTSWLVRSAVCEAVISLALRDVCVGDQLQQVGAASALVEQLKASSGHSAPRVLLLVKAVSSHREAMEQLLKTGLCSAFAMLARQSAEAAATAGTAESSAAYGLQRTLLQILQEISSQASLHQLLLQSGIPEVLGQLLRSCQSSELVELAVVAVNSLACGGRACQEALVKARVAGPLVRLLSTKASPQLMLKTLDAISNLTTSASASVQAVVGSAAEGAIFRLLARVLRSKQPLLIAKACRCLRNLTHDHAGNQAALLAVPVAVSALVSLLGCGLPQIVRLALGALANLVGHRDAGVKAAVLPVAVKLLCSAAAGTGNGACWRAALQRMSGLNAMHSKMPGATRRAAEQQEQHAAKKPRVC